MKKFIVAIILVAGCKPHVSGRVYSETGGYCFKAEGISKYRCYNTVKNCILHQRMLQDNHPWGKIQDSCKLR